MMYGCSKSSGVVTRRYRSVEEFPGVEGFVEGEEAVGDN